MPGVIGDLRGQRFGRLKVPDGADPVIHNHNAYRPVIYDAARWAWSLDSTCPAGSQVQTGRAAPGDQGAGGTATRSCVFRPATNDATRPEPKRTSKELQLPWSAAWPLGFHPWGAETVACGSWGHRSCAPTGSRSNRSRGAGRSRSWGQAAPNSRFPHDGHSAGPRAPSRQGDPNPGGQCARFSKPGRAQMSTPGRDQRAIEELDNEIELRPSKGAYMRRGNAFGDLGHRRLRPGHPTAAGCPRRLLDRKSTRLN